MPIFTNEKKIDKEYHLEDIELDKPDFRKTPLQLGSLPKWDRDVNGEIFWKKKGFFANRFIKDKPLVTLAEFWIINGNSSEQKYYKKSLPAIKFIESKCRRVVYTPYEDWDLDFYMAYINGKWYLVIFDVGDVAPFEVK
ncbi:MAG: hypothetical protein IPJ81_10450 [Chitinophagaceae bacterium]|nr:hypothetical protein [Chitinophagaceae bacterium]